VAGLPYTDEILKCEKSEYSINQQERTGGASRLAWGEIKRSGREAKKRSARSALKQKEGGGKRGQRERKIANHERGDPRITRWT